MTVVNFSCQNPPLSGPLTFKLVIVPQAIDNAPGRFVSGSASYTAIPALLYSPLDSSLIGQAGRQRFYGDREGRIAASANVGRSVGVANGLMKSIR